MDNKIWGCKEPNKYFPAKKTPMLPKDALKGKIAFITGGGSGLGKAMATMFTALGAQVAIASRDLKKLETAASEINKLTGGKVVPIQMNVKSAEDVKVAADKVEQQLGLPNIIVNNAAGNFISPTEKLSANAFKTVVDTVLLGTANVTLEFGKRLINAKQGAAFLAITAPYAREGTGFVSPSASAKAGVEILSNSLASEWGKYGLRFNCIAPGPIYTEGAFSRLDPTGSFLKESMNTMPVGRMGEKEELANLAAYLVSDYSNWMSGSIIDFDGGQQRMIAGGLNKRHAFTEEDWVKAESLIRTTNKSKL
jgi:2,4-dienoyl-CoA reductase